MDLSELYQNIDKSKEILQNIQKYFIDKTGYTPIMATELEFFFVKKESCQIDDKKLSELNESVEKIAENHGVDVAKISEESGDLQFEVNFKHSDDLIKIADDTENIKNILRHVAKNYELEVCFDAKPHQDKDVGSALHIHVSLNDDDGNNLYEKKDGYESQIFLSSIAGLLAHLKSSMVFFVKSERDFQRFNKKYQLDEKESRYKCTTTNAPTNISWGGNNRTTALRIPDCHNDPKEKRIEHRVPSSNANPYLAMSAVLLGVYLGLRDNLSPPEKIWGNAFDSQYNLPPLPLSYDEALEEYHGSELSDLVTFYL